MNTVYARMMYLVGPEQVIDIGDEVEGEGVDACFDKVLEEVGAVGEFWGGFAVSSDAHFDEDFGVVNISVGDADA